MASSNRHWPSLFKSKPLNNVNTLSQWQHDVSPSSTIPLNGCPEKSPEPKPRWNPKPEQIRILEGIFNSGMVNPPRDEIRKIRAQLQEYGHVGDANVFYWFQNRKSRTKNKQRHLHKHRRHPSPAAALPSSSSSSDKSPPNNLADIYNFATSGEFGDPTFPLSGGGGGPPQYTQGFCFSELSNVVGSGPPTNLLLSELMMSHANYAANSKEVQQLSDQAARNKLMMMSSCTTVRPAAPDHTTIPPPPPSTAVPVPSTVNLVQGIGATGAVGSRLTMVVFINDVAVEVGVGPFNVREAFGDDAVLLNSTGQPVLTDESGATLQSLQNGASYYLIL